MSKASRARQKETAAAGTKRSSAVYAAVLALGAALGWFGTDTIIRSRIRSRVGTQAAREAVSSSAIETTPASRSALPASGSRSVAGAEFDPALGSRPVFVDVTASTGIDHVHVNGSAGKSNYLEIMGSGCALFDYDADGDLDIYFVNGNVLSGPQDPSVKNRLYRNDGSWRFTDVTEHAGVGDTGYGQGCAVGDYDGDGDLDLYVSNYGPNVLYRNEGDGRFRDVTAETGVGDPGWGESCVFFDADGDGDLDLYVQNYLTFDASKDLEVWIQVGKERVRDYPSPIGFPGSPDRLFRNVGGGRFVDDTARAGIGRPDGKGMGVGCADFDADGDVDLFVANDSAENFFFRNRGDGTFEEVGLIVGVAFSESGVPEASMGVDVGDVDGDARLDLIVPCLERQIFTLYRNLGDRFDDVSSPAGLAAATGRATGFNANFLDYDADGDLDIFFANGGVRRNENAHTSDSYERRYGIRDILVANDGTGFFRSVSALAGPYFEETRIGRGSATGDLDGDGDLDLVICQLAGRPTILRNDTAGGRSLILELVDRAGQRQPIGTRVTVTVGARRLVREAHGGVSFLSQSDRRIHVGLGAVTSADRVEIRWPRGRVQVLENVPAAAHRSVREDG
jgi:hypothetical protein